FHGMVANEALDTAGDLPVFACEVWTALIEPRKHAAVSARPVVVAGVGLVLLAARGLARWPGLTGRRRRVMDLMRPLHARVIALGLILILGGGPVPGMIAIAIHTTVAVGNLFSEAAENA